MNLLQRYIFGQFSRYFLMVVSSLMAIYLLVDFFEKMDNFSEAGKTTALALQYLLLKIPVIIQQCGEERVATPNQPERTACGSLRLVRMGFLTANAVQNPLLFFSGRQTG